MVPPATDTARVHLPARPYICNYPYFAILVGTRGLRVRHPLCYLWPLAVLALPSPVACILRASTTGRIGLLARPPLGASSCAYQNDLYTGHAAGPFLPAPLFFLRSAKANNTHVTWFPKANKQKASW